MVNLQHLNQYLWKMFFKYEDLHTLMQILTTSDLMFTYDLKSGYYHLDIFPQHWQYLGFTWDMRSVTNTLHLQSYLLGCPWPAPIHLPS